MACRSSQIVATNEVSRDSKPLCLRVCRCSECRKHSWLLGKESLDEHGVACFTKGQLERVSGQMRHIFDRLLCRPDVDMHETTPLTPVSLIIMRLASVKKRDEMRGQIARQRNYCDSVSAFLMAIRSRSPRKKEDSVLSAQLSPRHYGHIPSAFLRTPPWNNLGQTSKSLFGICIYRTLAADFVVAVRLFESPLALS
jgi:hypothetical protein